MYPGHVKYIGEANQDATKQAYGYLLCDLQPELPVAHEYFSWGATVCLRQKAIKRLHSSDRNQLSMAQRLRKNHDFLKLLVNCT